MAKKFLQYLIIALLLATLCAGTSGCNSNNGDIGPWYGHWKLTKILVNGEADAQYDGNIFWAFQNSVVMMTEVNSDISFNNRWGSWQQQGDELTLDFTHHDDQSTADPATDWRYTPPAATHLTKGINKLHIDKLKDSEIVLTYHSPDGNAYTYYLKPWE